MPAEQLKQQHEDQIDQAEASGHPLRMMSTRQQRRYLHYYHKEQVHPEQLPTIKRWQQTYLT